jgi:predicted nucleic acid-binding protein
MNRYLRLAGSRCEADESILRRGEALERDGLKAMDALHVACAEALGCDYFITCDKRLINRCVGLQLKVINPLDLVLETSNDDPS